MNRRKVEALKQLESLKDESKFTVSLLQKLIDGCSKCVRDINQLDSKDLRLYSKYFLSVMQFQAASMQRVMEWNVEFEDFLSEKFPPSLETFKMLVDRRDRSVSEISLVSSQTSREVSSPTETVKNFLEFYNKDTVAIDLTLKCDDEVQVTYSNNIVEKNEVLPVVQIETVDDKTEKTSQKHTIACSEDKTEAPEARELKENQSIKGENHSTSSDDCAFETLESSFSSSDFLSMDDDKTSTASQKFNKNEQQNVVMVDNYCINISHPYLATSLYNTEEANTSRATALDVTSKPCENKQNMSNNGCTDLLESASVDKPIYVEKNLLKEKTASQYREFKKERQTSNIEPASTGSDECVFEDLNNFLSLDESHTEKAQEHKIIELEDNPTSFSQRMKAYPLASLYSIRKANVPRAPMPDVSLKPSEVIKESTPDIACSRLTSDNLRQFSEKQEVETTNVKVFSEHKSTVTIKNESPSITVKVGDLCMIGYVESPSEIYIQIVDGNSTTLNTIEAEVAEFCSNTAFEYASKSAARRALRDNVCAYCELPDCNWYRVEVVDWMMPESSQVTVYSIDYGCKYIVNYKQLLPLSKHLQQTPRIAQRCHLAYLYPPGSSKDKKVTVWPEEVTDSFYEILGDLNVVVFRIVHSLYDEDRKSYEIDITKLEEESSECTIGQILIDCGMAEEIIDWPAEYEDEAPIAPGPGDMEADTVTDILENYLQNDIPEEPNSISDAIMHYNPRDEAQTCKYLRKDGTCWRGKSCPFRHIPLTSGYTRDKHARYCRAFNDHNLPGVGEQVVAVISHVMDLDRFYVQITNQDGHYYPRHTTLPGLIETMNSPNVVKTYRPLKFIPSQGEVVIVKHWNSFWYRGQVKTVTTPEEGEIVAEVYVVDFGDILEVALSELREINPAFLHLSFQAVECAFYNVKHKEGSDRALEKLHFETNYLGRRYFAKIMQVLLMGVSGRLELLLYNSEQNEEVGLKMIEEGFGEFKTEHLQSADERGLVD